MKKKENKNKITANVRKKELRPSSWSKRVRSLLEVKKKGENGVKGGEEESKNGGEKERETSEEGKPLRR